MTTPFLIADAAEVAIMSPLAEAAFGSYDLQVPDGIDIEDIHDFEAPGNELGYVARLSPQRATGIARRFIRADVAVTAKDDTDPDVIPESDVDRVLSEAESRVESEFFLESDITKAGLGASVPYVNFNVGDIVNVRIFDIWVSLPVTRIEPIISEGDVVDWRVHVGGQLLSDDQAREVENATIQKELIQDRRDLAGIDAKATKAVRDSSEAKSTSEQAKQGTEDNRTYIDEQLDAAGAAVELGREYLLRMQQHVAAGVAHSGLAQSMASEANSYAQQAIAILEQLDPLRDDVAEAHAEVARLHQEASQFTEQAAEHVRQASQHAAEAKDYAKQALDHEAEGRRQATAALNSASAAQDSAAAAQGILDDADGILSQVQGYSQDAKDALNDAESLLANAGGSGKSLGDVLLEVAQKHQDTLNAHDDILDLHSEVLEKHSEAIRYVAIAAAQASSAAMHAAQAAQEALNVASDAARAAASAADAADEAAAAAENNRQAIGKLQEADGKLQEADQKLQQQIDVLEESQELLARAVQILADAVDQAAMAAQSALDASDNAGKAAGEALSASKANSSAIDAMEDAIEARDAAADDAGKAAGEALSASEHNSSAIDALEDTVQSRDAAIQAYEDIQTIIEDEQNDLIAQLAQQQKDLAESNKGRVNQIQATKAGTTWPGIAIQDGRNPETTWGFNLPDSRGALVHAEHFLRASGSSYGITKFKENLLTPVSGGWFIDCKDDEYVRITWGGVEASQVSIDKHQSAITPDRRTWTQLPSLTQKANSKATNGYLSLRVTWSGANRGSNYTIRILADGQEIGRKSSSSLGPLSFMGKGVRSQTVTVSNLTLAAGKSVTVEAYCSAGSLNQRRIGSAALKGTWIETQ